MPWCGRSQGFTQQLRILRKKFLFKLVNQRFAEFRVKLSVQHSLLSLAYTSRASKILASRILLGKMEDERCPESSNSIMRVGYIQSGLGLSFEMEQIAYITNDLQDCLLNVLVHNQATVVIEICKSIFADLIWKPFRKMRTIRVRNGRPSRNGRVSLCRMGELVLNFTANPEGSSSTFQQLLQINNDRFTYTNDQKTFMIENDSIYT